MMEIKVLDFTNNSLIRAELFRDEVFGKMYNQSLVHQVVEAYRANGRSGSKAQKSRAEVRGGGAKPWRQKGMGRARAGTIRSPIWRGGGVTFAAKHRDFSQKVNKKMYIGAMSCILSELLRQDRLLLVDRIVVSGKTKDFVKNLKIMELSKVLIVQEYIDSSLYLASRNIAKVEICDINEVNPIDLVDFDKILFTSDALRKIEERLL